MSDLADLIQKLEDSEPALDMEEYSTAEKVLIWILLLQSLQY